jgi:hypothetical protein
MLQNLTFFKRRTQIYFQKRFLCKKTKKDDELFEGIFCEMTDEEIIRN